jgi:repressor LexA
VAQVNDDITVKRFYHADGMVRLEPENARMRPIFVKDVKILGKVVGVVRKLL